MGVKLLLNIPFFIPTYLFNFVLKSSNSNDELEDVFMFKSRKHGVFAVDESLIVPVSINKIAIQRDRIEID